MDLSNITPFEDNYDPICMNKIFEAEKSEREPTFEKTINEIKSNRLKSITSIYNNVSYITSNKPSSSSEHLKSDLMSQILLQSPEITIIHQSFVFNVS